MRCSSSSSPAAPPCPALSCPVLPCPALPPSSCGMAPGRMPRRHFQNISPGPLVCALPRWRIVFPFSLATCRRQWQPNPTLLLTRHASSIDMSSVVGRLSAGPMPNANNGGNSSSHTAPYQATAKQKHMDKGRSEQTDTSGEYEPPELASLARSWGSGLQKASTQNEQVQYHARYAYRSSKIWNRLFQFLRFSMWRRTES
ncbi:hypothetical protein LX32DRAFT_107201 [Colletotrichum zoysiae]|uniref:Uncharacterized protein n=1 Tax=Colletotrichum zoysiae TaxID=1216348 RepID=A0AAD9HAF1_9PEZI|nr:hypothetical protein LX32DRAFT_107201 [Colletotrichum zoysiae]